MEVVGSCTSRCFNLQKMSSKLMELSETEAFSDVTLVIDGLSIASHKVILSAACPYFDAMFKSGMEEARSKRVELKFCDAPTIMRLLLDFIYSGKCDISTENIQSLVDAADLLGMDNLKQECGEFMVSQIDDNNCFGLRGSCTKKAAKNREELHSVSF